MLIFSLVLFFFFFSIFLHRQLDLNGHRPAFQQPVVIANQASRTCQHLASGLKG